MDPASEITQIITRCALPKLARNYDEIDNHPEYYDRQDYINKYFPTLLNLVLKHDLREHKEFSSTIVPGLLILCKERGCDGSWNQPKSREYAKKLNKNFHDTYGINLDSVLLSNTLCNVQEVFDNTLQQLNKCGIADDFKKYPGLIEVYCLLLKNIKEYNVEINPMKIFPISLLLIDDFIKSNKIRGLKCCSAIMQCLNEKDFSNGNYYEVLFGCLKKIVSEKDLEMTKLVQECLLQFIKIIPANHKVEKTDEILEIMLDQLHLESNLYRKTVCFTFIKNIIHIHQVNCINKTVMKTILCENIHVCCNDAVADILLVDVLECFQAWITYCWCVWRLSSDHKLLSALIKLLYVSRKEKIASDIQILISTLISLCSKDERKMILNNLETCTITAPEFKEKLEEIKKDILI